MAEKRRARAGVRKPVDKAVTGWTDVEKAAMREHARDMKAAAKRGGHTSRTDGEKDVLAKIADMKGSDRALAERIHALVLDAAPDLMPRTWYGMPAWAKDGNVVCFFQAAQKFKSRYATFGFSDKAALDEGDMWPTSYALKALTVQGESRIRALVRKAAS